MSSGQEKPEGYVFGRPTKYKPEYCQMLIDHMSQGLSYESFAASISVSRETLYQWEKDQPDFSYSKKIAKGGSLLFLEKLGLNGAQGKIKGFNVASWIFICKNRHPDMFKDQVEVGNSDAKPFMLKYSL